MKSPSKLIPGADRMGSYASGPALFIISFLAALPSLLLCGCSGGGPPAGKTTGTKPSVPVIVAQAESRNVPIELRNIGNVEAYATVTIRSQITGQIKKIHFLEGQEVKAGDPLFTIDPRPSQGALRQAQADLKRDQAQLVSVKLEFERARKLFESSIGSRDDYDKAEATFHALEATIMSDEASVSKAQLQVEFTSIRSPIDGRTGNLMVREGNVVKAPDDLLVTINQVHPIYVTFSVPEQDLPAIRRRMRETTLTVQAQPPVAPALSNDTSVLPVGELTFIDNAVDATTGRIKLKATFQNGDSALWPGQFVQTLLTLDTLHQATVVPTQAVQASQTGDYVFIVKPDSTVEKRTVVAGISRDNVTVLESGVKSGDTVVTDGHLRLTTGAKVTTQPVGQQSSLNADSQKTP